MRGPNFFLGKNVRAGVVIHCPPLDQEVDLATPAAPIDLPNRRVSWQQANYIELVVDGQVVDLNRIPLPADTPIIDERFKDEKHKQ